jgi:CheY-like chemotaxis protein
MQEQAPGRVMKLVMVVEDDHLVRDIIAETLATDGFEVLTAGDGFQALDQLARFRTPSMVVVDLGLPRLDGRGFIQALRADPRWAHLPVIALTPEATLEPLEGVVAVMRKPVDLIGLVDRVRRHAR